MGKRWLMISLTLLACGCSQDADRLGRICEKTASRFEGATEGLRDKLCNGWSTVRGSPVTVRSGDRDATRVDSRVAMRLRWDKDMSGSEITVSLAGPGVIELSGSVADLTQRRRAVELAQTTNGVESVLDRLSVEADADKP